MPNVIKGLFNLEEDLSDYLDEIAYIPRDVQAEMLKAEADIIVEAQKKTAREMLTVDGGFGASGKYTDVRNGVINSIRMGRIKKNSGEPNMYHTDVIFKGEQHHERLAAIAFMNEYGVVHPETRVSHHAYTQPARPFISRANLYNAEKAVKAAAEIFKKKFLKLK